MQKRDFETDQRCFQDFEILPKFFETHVFFKYLPHFWVFPSCFIVINFLKSIKTRDHGGLIELLAIQSNRAPFYVSVSLAVT